MINFQKARPILQKLLDESVMAKLQSQEHILERLTRRSILEAGARLNISGEADITCAGGG